MLDTRDRPAALGGQAHAKSQRTFVKYKRRHIGRGHEVTATYDFFRFIRVRFYPGCHGTASIIANSNSPVFRSISSLTEMILTTHSFTTICAIALRI
jgi:hypothetical protein